ncbi:MAG: hypothetical protein KDC83_13575 [Flavobacteriales bacterium]|nr:hypothetical protein [Flavobacteriales bacterium]
MGTKFYGHLVNLENSITYSETNWDQLIPPGCVVMMDHSTSIFTKSLLKVLNNKNIPVGMLMHGLDPTSNLLHDENSVELPGIGAFSYLSENSSLFVVNNSVYAEKCLRFGVAPDKMRILGSPRFSKKWSMTLSNLLPNSDIKKYGNGQFKVCIMLSKWMYNNWEEETHRVIRTLLRIDGVFLFIKPHTRGMKFENKSSENCFVDNENTYNSRSIIEWSNLVLFSISSIFLDALLLDKPVLHLKLTTSNKMACQHIMKSWNVDCRDDLIHWVEKLKKDEFCRTYTKKEAEDCLDYYVKDRDGKMLERYCSEILEIGKNGK